MTRFVPKQVLSLLLVALAFAAAPAAAATYLWEVTGLANRVYLYGTVHAGKKDWYPLPREVEEAFADSKVLVVEADVSDTAALRKYDTTMIYTPPDSLAKHVPPEQYERFRKLLPRYSLAESGMAQVKPFMAVSTLVFMEWARQGYLPAYGIDGYLLAKAKAEGKTVVEIEGIDAQMKLMDSLTEQENAQLFAGTVMALETGLSAEQINGLVKAWQDGDPDALLDMARKYNEQVKGAAEFEEKFIWGRHEDMVKKIEGYLGTSKDRHFIAVGSLHLAGPRGLVEMLRKRGYPVKQR
jgi:uncharacterized protein YbaP (TraB family)